MNKFKFLSLTLFASASALQAQDINEVKKQIDAEQFQKAKTSLKSIIKADPSEGKAYFLLGNIYLNQNVIDSAKITFNEGLKAKDAAHFNNIGLGQIDLENKDVAAAKTKFDLVKSETRKKDFEEYIYIAKAYMNNSHPDYKAALATLALAKEKNPTEPQVLLALGDAFYGDKNQNEAFTSYRNAFQGDNTLIRAKMQLGVLLKGAKAYQEAVAAYNEVIALSPNYGPVYRELAQTYYYWALNVPGRYDQYIKQALTFYEKYMSLTDYSLASRMRHADFLILAKDYKALEIEANKMKELDNVNPRIYRYLGYAAYENGNIDAAISSLQDFVNNPSNKVIALDYLYLGQAKIKKGTNAEGTAVDPALYAEGIDFIKKAVELEPAVADGLGDMGKKFYEKKMFKEAAAILELATSYKESRTFLIDNFYLGNAIYFSNAGKEVAERDMVALKKADTAYANVLEASPDTVDAYISRARTNSLLEDDQAMIKYYQEYIDHVSAKGAEELAKPAVKTKLIEAYNTMGAGYANFDKAKAIEHFNKTLALDPANKYATQSLKSLQ
ncbi:tetratricopeptide repeat protein [Flavobacterium flavipallidum]|uniref:Tetratricopeptide repeat protein n=1 Tax=Flavobacterium flavipallidum TaxID=3139140 RepID=A0ABU9HLC1_9FLAO